MEQIVKIKSYNPYGELYPDLKVISKENLLLLKELRKEGIKVIVEPDDNREICYFFKKGAKELFEDPMFLFLISIPVTIAITLVTNALDRILQKSKTDNKKGISENVIINAENCFYNINGTQIITEEVNKKINESIDLQRDFNVSFRNRSIKEELPIPIFLEHEPKVVGWGRVTNNEKGLYVEEAEIIDNQAKAEISNRTLTGFSIGGIALKSKCSICEGNYVDCTHVSGKIYNQEMCVTHIEKSIPIEISLVQKPINERCRIQIK